MENVVKHSNHCIQLSTENKINTRNAFSLQLIDNMSIMLEKEESSINYFHIASGMIDASTKIYACRVEKLHGETLKMEGNLGQIGRVSDEEEEVEEQVEFVDRQRKRRSSKSVETNLKNINQKRLELDSELIPLFQVTRFQFDRGNQFLASLQVKDDTCELMLNWDTTHSVTVRKTASETFSTISSVDFRRLEMTPLCPTFEQFSFKWSLEEEEEEENGDNEFSSRNNESISDRGEFAFDISAVTTENSENRDDYSEVARDVTVSVSPKEKKIEIKQLNYKSYTEQIEDEDIEEVMKRVESLLQKPQKRVKLAKRTWSDWSSDKYTLPEKEPFEFGRLKTLDMKIPVDNCDPADTGEYGGVDVEIDEEENLVSAPSRAVDRDALQISYDKTAKKVDMERIKSEAWNILTHDSLEKEDHSSSQERQVVEEEREEPGIEFSSLYRTLKNSSKIGKTMAENLSVPLAFVAVLQLSNEENLSLIPRTEMDGFSIRLP